MLKRFKPGEPFGVMTPKGLVIGQREADRLNAIAEALEKGPAHNVASSGRVRRTPAGLVCDEEIPETFHARLTSAGPSYEWVEIRRNAAGTGWEDRPGGRNSTDDGIAREYNEATGLSGKRVLMQRWPGNFHRFQRAVVDGTGDIGGGEPGGGSGQPCWCDDMPATMRYVHTDGLAVGMDVAVTFVNEPCQVLSGSEPTYPTHWISECFKKTTGSIRTFFFFFIGHDGETTCTCYMFSRNALTGETDEEACFAIYGELSGNRYIGGIFSSDNYTRGTFSSTACDPLDADVVLGSIGAGTTDYGNGVLTES